MKQAIQLLLVFAAGFAVNLSPVTSAERLLDEDAIVVRDKLESEWWKTFTSFNYHDVGSRQYDDGFFQESPSGGYVLGFWPRTCSPLAKLWLNTGENDRVKRLLKLTLDVTAAEGQGRMPHVIFPANTGYTLPIEGTDVAVQVDMSTALYRLDGPFSGAQGFIAPDRPILAVEAGLGGGTGTMTAVICKKPDGEAVAEASKYRNNEPDGFVRFEFDKPVQLEAGKKHYLQIKWKGDGVLVWQGKIDASHPLAGTMARDHGVTDQWEYDHKTHVTAFAIDTGTLEHATLNLPARAGSMADQIDGQAHLLLGWALYINRSGDTAFADETYEQVAALMDSSVRPPYMTREGELGNLIYNSNLEHSREGYFLTTYDMLAQSFIAQALREMIKVAETRGDTVHAKSWAKTLATLEAAIADKMTWTLDGQKIYVEMYKKEMDGTILDGLSWVNLGITASGWEGVDEALYVPTIDMYTKKATFLWKGHKVLGIQYTGGRETWRSAIGKGIGWELLYHAQRGNWARVNEVLDFVYDAHEGNALRQYGEAYHMQSEDSEIVHQDPGNGEQVTWFLCCLSEVRKLLNLAAMPL